MPRSLLLTLLSAVLLLSPLGVSTDTGRAAPQEEADEDACFDNPSYVIYRTPGAIEADGRLDESAWTAAPWTSSFVEMADGTPLASEIGTRVGMLWDDDALYVAAEIAEPHVWATLTERDSRIYLDNAFEIFVDPDGDTHQYYELEFNALGTWWDLLLVKPYRDGGPALSAWDVRGIEIGVHVNGTLNDPTDTDDGWMVEVALPWAVLVEAAPASRRPAAGEQWRMNFSRSHWSLEVVDGAYRKIPDRPADWSAWSPQGAIDIHRPECWGFVQFADVHAGKGTVAFREVANERVKRALRRLYYRQRDYLGIYGRYADDVDDLDPGDITVEGMPFEPQLRTTQTTYEITAPGSDGSTVHIRHDGRVWTSVE